MDPPGAARRELDTRMIEEACNAWHSMHALWTSLPIGDALHFVW